MTVAHKSAVPRRGRSPDRPSTAALSHVVHRLAWIILVVILLALLDTVVSRRSGPLALASVSLALCAACWLLVLTSYGWAQLPRSTLRVLSTPHPLPLRFGLDVGLGEEEVVLRLSGSVTQWLTAPDLYRAAYLSAVWIASFAVVASFLGVATRSTQGAGRWASARDGRTSLVGVLLEVMGLGTFLVAFMRAGGVSLIGGGYGLFLENAQDSTTTYGIWAMSLGFNLSQLGDRRTRQVGLIAFGLFAAIAFPLGMRGTVLFPLICALVARQVRGLRTPAVPLAIGAVGFAALSSVVRVTRGGSDRRGMALGIVETLAEMGFSIKPVLIILNYREVGAVTRILFRFLPCP